MHKRSLVIFHMKHCATLYKALFRHVIVILFRSSGGWPGNMNLWQHFFLLFSDNSDRNTFLLSYTQKVKQTVRQTDMPTDRLTHTRIHTLMYIWYLPFRSVLTSIMTSKWSEETAEKLQFVVCRSEAAAPLVRERPFIRIKTGTGFFIKCTY